MKFILRTNQVKSWMRLRRLVGFWILMPTVALGQAVVHSSLTGKVLDPAERPVGGATVTLTEANTNARQQTQTDDRGLFFFGRLDRGIYRLEVEKAGFRRVLREGLEIAAGEAAVADVRLELGEVTSSVTVTAESSVVQAQTSAISILVDNRRVNQLPLNGKNFLKLLILSPGVGAPTSTLSIANLPVNGARASANTYSLDGVSFNDERFDSGIAVGGGPAGFSDSAPNLISTEAIQEFRLVSSNADATYGRGSGGQIAIISRSGTNQYHGAAYEYLRNSALDARDFFNYGPFRHPDGRAKTPPLRQHLFGGRFGGPIEKDRHFFFGNYEAFLQRRELTFTPVVPNATLLRLIPGDLGRFYRTYFIERQIVPASGNPSGPFRPLTATDRQAAINAGFPVMLFDGDLGNDEVGTALLSASARNDVRHHSFLLRTDHRLTPALSLSARYTFARPRQLNSQGFDVVEANQRVQSLLLQGVYTISPTQMVEVRGAIFRSRTGDGLQDLKIDPRLAALGLPPNGVSITVSGTTFPSIFLQPVGSRVFQTVPQGSAMHFWTGRSLLLRTGVEFRDVSARFRRGFQETPTYDFRGFIGRSGLLGSSPAQPEAIADSVFGTVLGTNGGPTTSLRGWRSLQQDYFSQLDWRLHSRLTLNLGLRYSFFGVQREDINAASNLFAIDSSGRVQPDLPPFTYGRTANRVLPLSGDLQLYTPDRNNLQPRIGTALDLTGDGKTILRAAYGVYVDRIFQGHFALNVGNIPYATASFILFAPFRLGPTFPVNPSTPSFWAVDPTLRNPQTQRWNAALERALDADTAVTLAWVSARARGLLRALEPNGSGTVPQALRPDPRFSDQRLVTNYSSADYDSLQISARRRFSRGLSLTFAYTFAESKDNLWQDALLATPRAPSLLNLAADPARPGVHANAQFVDRPVRADWGFSDFDIRHYLVGSWLWELPFGRGRRFLSRSSRPVSAIASGWMLSGLLVRRGGEPVDLRVGRDINGDGDATRDRPALLQGSLGDLYAAGKYGKTQWLIPLAEAGARLGNPSDPANPFATVARNALRSPAATNLDLSLFRRFSLAESLELGVEANVFNIFNHANLAAPISTLSDARFGVITATRRGYNPRQIQFGVRLQF